MHKNNTKIHVIVFFERENLYIIKEMYSALVYTGNYFRDKSHFESSFDRFDLRQCYSNEVIWYLPKQLTKFLTQTKTSRFNECYENLNFSDRLYYHSSSDDRRNFRSNQQQLELTKIVRIDQNCGNSKIVIFIDSAPTTFEDNF